MTPSAHDGVSLIEAIDKTITRDWERLHWHPTNGGWLQIAPLGSIIGLGGEGLRTGTPSEASDFTNSALLGALRSGELAVCGTRSDDSGAWSLAAPAEPT